MNTKKLENLIDDFNLENLESFLFDANFKKDLDDLSSLNNEEAFEETKKIGYINTKSNEKILVSTVKVADGLSERSSRKKQFDFGKKVVSTDHSLEAGIFVFYDNEGNFRFSLIHPTYRGTRRSFNSFKRYTFYVINNPNYSNKTFLQRIGGGDFSSLEKIKEAFAVGPVTDIFYKDFLKIYNKVVQTTKEKNSIEKENAAREFVLLFVIRTVFLGFIQKKKWIGDDAKFMQHFLKEYKDQFPGKDQFYNRWLKPLFFEALNTPLGTKVAYGNNEFSKETEEKLQMVPYLNGGLFKPKSEYDDKGWTIPDQEIYEMFEFLFSHNFTIEENSPDDEDLQLNPEFLGIIFERLVNKEDGAVYTPRTEVDLMCRLSLVKWLQKNLESSVKVDNLYELFFRESEEEENQKHGSFSKKEAEQVIDKLQNLAICDPSVGSGAFLVGMMHVLDETEQSLRLRYDLDGKSIFERKKEIIKYSLYGVEVKEWAVWICQLRLWLSLFVDAPDDLKNSLGPILPSLDFKVRQGDSLVQRIGSKAFPISGHNLSLSKSIKDKITKLRNLKLQYFDNKSDLKDWELKQREFVIYKEILDTEIKEKEGQLRSFKNIKPTEAMSLFGDKEESKQETLAFDKEEVDNLELEITELKEQKQALHSDNKPLVWSIEFAEVFTEKGGFDIVIGNPPYVRHEDISDPTGKIKDKKEYKNCLEEMVKLDFPNDFPPKSRINAQSDLYTYFYIRALRLLNQQGIHTFICSNSWLDVGYGVWLQDFLLKRCPVELIIDNHAKRSFGAADVNTVISIIHAPQKKADKNHLVKFVAFKKPFEEVIYTENILAIENANKIESNDVFRVYPITTEDLREAGIEYEENALTQNSKYIGNKWGGKYLRAPDIFFTILEKGKGKGKLAKLGDIAEVRFGIKTGVNDFFYLTDEQINHWGIEEEFLKPVIKSPRECKSILVNPKDLKYKIFICNKTKEELIGTNALKYIEWGEKLEIVVKQGKDEGNTIRGVQNISSVKGRNI